MVAFESLTPSADRACPAVENTRLRCSVDGGTKTWRGVHDAAPSIPATHCPVDSVPWRAQAVCDNSGRMQCFKTRMENVQRDVGVCIVPVDVEQPMEPTPSGKLHLDYAKTVSYDRRLDPSMLADYDLCMVTPYQDLTNAALHTSVPKNDTKLCDQLVADARETCIQSGKTKEQCADLVQPVQNGADTTFRCALQTGALPVGHRDDPTWWRWRRHNQYPCRSAGWKCEDAALSEFRGGSPCSNDMDCNAAAELGVCHKDKCLVGQSKTGRCNRHEDCDILEPRSGKCSVNGLCLAGKTNLGVSYYAPRECKPNADENMSLHSYCGERLADEGGVAYTGMCVPFDHDGHTFHGCRAFQNADEILRTVAEELDFKEKRRRGGLFDAALPAWQFIEECPSEATSIIGGQKVCLHTTQTIPAYELFAAKSVDDAARQCASQRCTDAKCPVGLCTRSRSGECTPVPDTTRVLRETYPELGAGGPASPQAQA